MSNIVSKGINVFPLATPRTNNRGNNLFYERNISNIVNQISDVPGFVITKNEQISDIISLSGTTLYINSQSMFDFSLGGRYFSIGNTDDTINEDITIAEDVNNGDSIWANIEIKDNGQIIGQDEDDYYKGLTITVNGPAGSENGGTVLSLEILNIDDEGNVKVPQESYTKFNLDSISSRISFIDGRR